MGNITDPQKGLIHDNIKRSLLEITDSTFQYAQIQYGIAHLPT